MPAIGGFAGGNTRVVTDTFARTVSGSLGTAESGRVWSAVSGTWSANGSAATSADTASTYPLASQLSYQDVTVSADVSGGTGVAFWVGESAGNWWASYPAYDTTTTSSCNTGYGTYSNTSSFCGSYTTIAGSTTCTGTAVHCYTSGCAPGGCGTVSESTGGGTTSCTGTVAHCYTAGCTPAGNTSSCAISETTGGGTTSCTGTVAHCYTAGCTPAGNTSSCAISQTTGGGVTTCTGAVAHCYTAACTPTGSCGAISETTGGGVGHCTGAFVHCYTSGCNPGGCGTTYQDTGTAYSCPSGQTLSGTTCYQYSPGSGYPNDLEPVGPATATTTYDRYQATIAYDPITYDRSSATSVTSAVTYDRSSATSVTSGITYDRSSATTVTTPITYDRSQATNVTGATTYSGYTGSSSSTSYVTSLIIVSSVSSTVVSQSQTTLATTSSLSSVGSIKVTTSGNQITATAYTSTGLITQLGSPLVYTATTPSRGQSVGIIKAPSVYGQGTQVDTFSAKA